MLQKRNYISFVMLTAYNIIYKGIYNLWWLHFSTSIIALLIIYLFLFLDFLVKQLLEGFTTILFLIFEDIYYINIKKVITINTVIFSPNYNVKIITTTHKIIIINIIVV